jgi:hypothetical protein
MTTTISMSGPGTTVITDDVALAITNQTIAQQALMNSLILQIGNSEVPGTLLGILSATQGTLSIMTDKITSLDNRLKELGTNVGTISGQMEQSRTGLAVIASTMAKQTVISQLQYLDNAKHSEFQQQTVNASLKDAGKPPTVVTPAAFVAKVENTIKEVTTINAQTSIVTTVTTFTTTVLVSAYEQSLAWAAQTAIGTWITSSYATIKAKVTAIFSAEKAIEAAQSTLKAGLDIKAGNPTSIAPNP